MNLRAVLVLAVTLAACGDRKRSEGARTSPLETAIARDLTAKLAQPVTTTCATFVGAGRCEAKLADGTKIPIEVTSEGKDWAWHVVGRVIDTGPIKTYVEATLGDLHVAQTADCGARFAYVAAGDRLACKLSAGGIAFVQLAPDGTASLELAMDPASAAARGELVTPPREQELTKISKALENLEGESDGEEEVPTTPGSDGGVANP